MPSISKKQLEQIIVAVAVIVAVFGLVIYFYLAGALNIMEFFINPPAEPQLSALPEPGTGAEAVSTTGALPGSLGEISGFVKCGVWPINNVELSADRGNPFMPKPGVERLTGLRDTSTANCLPADQAVLHQQ